ncbi:restriction endonuclease [Leucothrix pacifica]|uniref:restriction endonuclease n=1 Tax=Leucothrix pacifica TaxID=1247513 RepID=UPI001C63D623
MASLCSEEYKDQDFIVIPNAKIEGRHSEASRQVDVLIDYRFNHDKERRIIVDAKRYNRPLNVKDIESFHGMMEDCSASTGILVCPKGYTNAAKKRARNYIRLK